MFTFDELQSSLGTSIFRNSSSATNHTRPDYLPDYLFVSYDYALSKVPPKAGLYCYLKQALYDSF